MIESALVYIRRNNELKAFIGCGTVLSGGVIATCRHVWRDATAGIDAAQTRTVLIEYPPDENRAGAEAVAELADECPAGAGGKAPDLVLLRPKEEIGFEVARLAPAMREISESGPGYALTVLYGRDENRPTGLQPVEVDGTISPNKRGGLRQFTGSGSGYWFAPGSSGSPAFLATGEQLAGMISLSETGERPGESVVHAAFVVPGTTIGRYLRALEAKPTAVKESIPADRLQPILDAIGADQLSVAEIPDRLRAFVEAARAREAEPVAPSNRGEGVDEAIAAARRQLVLDPDGARRLLTDRIEDGREGLLALLRERAEIERLVFDHEAAKATRQEIARLAPDDAVNWGELGDLWRLTGLLDAAAEAFVRAEAAASGRGDERMVAVSNDRLGDVRVAQGDLDGALASYTEAMRIRERLAVRDPGNTEWQRDLSISHNKLGNVRVAQGDLDGALASYTEAMRIRERLAVRDPANTEWQRDLSISHNKLGNVRLAQGDLDGALASYTEDMRISEGLAARDPANTGWQRDLSISHNKLGDVRVAQGDLDGALASYTEGTQISERLAARDPANTEWQRDLSISHEKLGNVRVAQGDLDGALASYTEAMRIRERLAVRDPANTGWQRDLSISHNKLGDVRVAQGDLDGALASYTEAMRIREGLAARDPANTEWQRDLIVSCVKLADVAPAQAAEHLRRALAIAQSLEDAGRLAPRDSWMPGELERRLSALDGGAA